MFAADSLSPLWRGGFVGKMIEQGNAPPELGLVPIRGGAESCGGKMHVGERRPHSFAKLAQLYGIVSLFSASSSAL